MLFINTGHTQEPFLSNLQQLVKFLKDKKVKLSDVQVPSDLITFIR
jgi:hypothetical protein